MKINFGKYKGKELKDIPKDYLLWIYDNCKMNVELMLAVAEQLEGYDDSEHDWDAIAWDNGDFYK